MGSRLRRQLREALPCSVKGLQRAIALEIADDARYDDAGRYDPENGRCSKVRLSDLVRWTGAKDELSVREMLRRMALVGWEFRLEIGKGKDGRPLYAVPGHAMQFRVPDFEGPTVVGPFGAEGPTVVAQGPTLVGEGPTTVGEGPTVVGPPSQEPPLASHRYPASSTPGAPEGPAATVPSVTDGGGGGDLRSIASEITASLDYRGKTPDKKQQRTITDRLAAALDSGWSVDGLALYLDLGEAPVQSPAAVYAHRLRTDVLPDAVPDAAPQRPLGGIRGDQPTAAEYAALTIEDVLGSGRPAGGMWEEATQRARARLGAGDRGRGGTVIEAKHKPYSNDAWSAPAIEADMAKIPHCGDLDCDPRTRLRDGRTDDGLPYSSPCEKCHPRMRW